MGTERLLVGGVTMDHRGEQLKPTHRTWQITHAVRKRQLVSTQDHSEMPPKVSGQEIAEGGVVMVRGSA
ncbi:hypothetical protein GCM10010525_20780 [Glutamicibacter bergerei]